MSARSQCVAPRSKSALSERCHHPAKAGSEWCGLHARGGKRFAEAVQAASASASASTAAPDPGEVAAARRIHRVWQRWLARSAGPLLPFKEESNNPADFFSGDPVQEIPLRYFISFVDADRKGYIMDIRSVEALFAHNTVPTNPFNRAAFPASFLRRLRLHQQRSLTKTAPAPAPVLTQDQLLALEITDTFRHLEDIGYYTDPTWFQELHRFNLQRFYIELADIWYHRALLTHNDRQRIVPTGPGLPLPVRTVLVMSQKALRHTIIRACKALIISASARADRQLGAMYVLGALTLVSRGAATAYPWLLETFSPGATRLYQSLETGEIQLRVSHPAVLEY